MADKSRKFAENTPGIFYVDDQCIACDACCVEAPGFFIMNDLAGHAFVAKQPQTPKELADCLNALEACPVLAIGNDGLSST
jgi:ferredoxin